MVPDDLHGRVSFHDEMNLSRVYEAARSYRKIGPVLRTIVTCSWEDIKTVKPYLMRTLEARSDARQMKASDDWEAFWSGL